MRFSCLTLFPDMIKAFTDSSILGRALRDNLFELDLIQIRDFAVNEYGKVDDALFGGGTGMLMMAEPIWQAAVEARKRFAETGKGSKEKVLYLSPRGRTLDQNMAGQLLENDHLILLCGHYEGVDARVLDELEAEEVSIGDYVMSGGELAASVLIDVCARMIPGVLPAEEAWQHESHSSGLLEENQYTRPATWRGRNVPSVLLSGHQANIDAFRRAQSLLTTIEKRPDLLVGLSLPEEDWKMAAELLDKAVSGK